MVYILYIFMCVVTLPQMLLLKFCQQHHIWFISNAVFNTIEAIESQLDSLSLEVGSVAG